MLQRRWFLPATVFLVCWTLTTHGKYSASGDEPHYLLVTQSLLADGDLDLRNNHATGQSSLFGVDNLQPGMHVRETRAGRLLPVHDVGLSITLLPVYFVATRLSRLAPEPTLRRFRMNRGLFAYSLISVFIIGVTVTAAAITRRALIASGTGPSIASALVLATWLSPPVLSNSFLVFPEAFALLVSAWAVRIAAAGDQESSRLRPMLWVLSLGLLPWFHRKYALYGVAVLLAVAWRQREKLTRITPYRWATGLVVFATPQIALAVWTWIHWGNLAGPLALDRVPFSWNALGVGWLGQLVDRENGLFIWAPIYLLLPLAWALDARRNLIWLLPTACLFIMSAAHDQWWGGFSPAGRFLVPVIPMFTFAGAALIRHPSLRWVCAAVLLPQLLISAYGWHHPRWLWPQGDGHNRILSAVLEWFGGNADALPSLRSTDPATGRAGVLVTLIAAANGSLWLLMKAGGSRERSIPNLVREDPTTRRR